MVAVHRVVEAVVAEVDGKGAEAFLRARQYPEVGHVDDGGAQVGQVDPVQAARPGERPVQVAGGGRNEMVIGECNKEHLRGRTK